MVLGVHSPFIETMVSLLLITGPSGCGKSTIAKTIAQQIYASEHNNCCASSTNTINASTATINANENVPERAVVIHQDDYFTKEFITYKDRTDDSYENDSGVDWGRLKKDIVQASASGLNVKSKAVVVEGHILSAFLLSSSQISIHIFLLPVGSLSHQHHTLYVSH